MLAFLTVLGLAVTTAGSSPKTDTPRALIERAIDAQGGEKQVAKLLGPTKAKVKGKSGLLEMKGEILQQPPSQCRITSTLGLGPLPPVEVVVVTNGDQAWRNLAGFKAEITGKDLAEMQDGAYRHRVQNLIPLLREPGFELLLLPQTTISDQPAVGIRVQSKGHRDIDLYFDKSTGLVVKTASRILQDGKPALVLEKIISEYRDFGGLKLATRFTKYENQKQTSVEEIVDIKFVNHIDEREFEKP